MFSGGQESVHWEQMGYKVHIMKYKNCKKMNVTSSSALFKTAQCWLFIVFYRYIVICYYVQS